MTTTIQLDDAVDFDGFRSASRRLLVQGIEPRQVAWQVANANEGDLFGGSPGGAEPAEPAPPGDGDPGPAGQSSSSAEPSSAAPAPHVPKGFVELCRKVVLHHDPSRFDLLYRLLWRLNHEPALRGDPLDPDRLLADQMAHAVRREMHKMTAFVRFRRIEPEGQTTTASSDTASSDTASTDTAAANEAATAATDAADVLHVAWFEPAHHIVEATAPFFARRFAQMRWAILTPERCVRWDGATLSFGPGAKRDKAPLPDAGERLWLTYYQSIFNPSRLKLAMMTKEMPRRYWHNLPEAQFISALTAQANQRSTTMIDAPASTPRRRVVPLHVSAAAAPPGAEPSPPADLADLKHATDHCRACPIGEHATQSVSGEGPVRAPLMFVGEQPGDQEDLRGRPFVGPAGKLFDRALAQLGWPRDALYVTNAVRHFKYELRGQRRIHKTPAQQEASACLHWLEREIELVQPQAIVALGATAARSLLGTPVAVMRERGRWLQRADGRRVLITLHPSALLRMPPADQGGAFDAWLADLMQAAEVMLAA